ncbi:MAG: hypothetical protein R3321_11750, partial [Nitrososphaeraceae archaeon]|nr:hypothetical protein [Nitrososphaeraceae archaeon]
MKVYRTLKSAKKNKSDYECILSQDIDQTGRKSFVCVDEQLLSYLSNKNGNYYEVLENDAEVCIYFDIDNKEAPVGDYNEYLQIILSELNKYTYKKLDESNYCVFDSSTVNKDSFHIHTNVKFKNIRHCKEFVKSLNNKYIDPAVYTHNRSFRLVNNSKKGSTRVKKYVFGNEGLKFISLIDEMIECNYEYKEIFVEDVSIDYVCDRYDEKELEE